MFIILPLTCATPKGPGGQASGWISVAFCALGVLGFILIKLVFARKIQSDLDRASSAPFVNYSYVYMKLKHFK